MKTLLVEDDPVIRYLVEQILKVRGHEVAAFAAAEMAWAAIETDGYALVIIDWVLPGLDGLELCRHIRSLPDSAYTEILVMTAHDRPDGLALALDAGANDYLLKPFTLQHLKASLTVAERRVASALEHKVADETLRESEERYRTMAETAADGIITIDAASRIQAVNAAAVRIFGYTREELLGQPLTMLMPEHLRQRHLSGLASYVAAGTRHLLWTGAELAGLHKDGHEISLEISYSESTQRGMRLFTGVMRDTTERARADRERAELLRRTREAGERAEATAARIARLHAVTSALSEARSREQVATVIVREGVAALRAQASSLALLVEDGTMLEIVAAVGDAADSEEPSRRFPVTAVLPLTDAARTAQPVWLASPKDWAARYTVAAGAVAGRATRAWAAVPLVVEGLVVGALGLSFAESQKFDDDDRRLILALAQQCAQALERTRLYAAEQSALTAAEATEAQLRAVIQACPIPVTVVDRQGKVQIWNPACARVFGWQESEVMGRYPPWWNGTEHEFQTLKERALRGELGRGVEVRRRTKDGAWHDLLASASPLYDGTGAVTGVVAQLVDMTERRRTEEAMRKSVEEQRALATLTRLANSALEIDVLLPRLCQAILGAAAASDASVFLLAGPETLRLAATTIADRPTAQTLGPLAAHVFAAGQAARDRRPLAYDEVSPEPARRAPPQGGGPAPSVGGASVLAAPLILADEVIGAVALGNAAPESVSYGALERVAEIAEIVASALRNARHYQREHEVAEALRHMERWRSSFLRVMAHEVRTPLNHITGFSDLLAAEAARLTERGQRYLTNVQGAAARLEALVQRSFDLLRLYEDAAPVDRAPVEVGHLVETVLATYRAPAEAKGVVLRSRRPGEPMAVAGDTQQLQQVLAILLDNAVKFTPPEGAIEVAVQLRAGLVEIAVCDNGPGVPVALRASIFGGGQAEDALTRQHGGLGISLLMAQRIADLHGGELRLDVPEQGSCFVVTLPVLGVAARAARTVVNPAILHRQLVVEPGALAVVYWGLERLTPGEALPALAALQGHERVVMVGRFAYVEAPSPGRPERRAGHAAGDGAQAGALRLADLLTDPSAMNLLEDRVYAALEETGLTVAGAQLGAQTGLPWRTLEAVCYAWEEKGIVQVVPVDGTAQREQEGDFVVLQVTLSAATKAPLPPWGFTHDAVGDGGA